MSPSNYKTIRAKAPGSMMVMGEHAVLRGYPALVCAVDQKITVCLRVKKDAFQPGLYIHSALGDKFYTRDALQILQTQDNHLSEKPFHFALSGFLSGVSFEQFPDCTLHLSIESEFHHELGLGSSAGVTVAALGASLAFFDRAMTQGELIQVAVRLIRSNQNHLGSGADVAASVLGGMVWVSPQKNGQLQTEKLLFDLPLYGLYTGSKMPTPEVVTLVNEKEKLDPKKYQTLFQEMGTLTSLAHNTAHFPTLLQKHHKCQQQLGVSNEHIETLKNMLEAQPGILAAKLSGAGLGDCLLALGRPQTPFHHWLPKPYLEQGVLGFPVELAKQGLEVHITEEVPQ